MPPKSLPPKTTATREFFGTDETDAPSNDELESASPSPELPPENTDKGKGGQKAEAGEKQEEKQRSPSPTPSEIVLRADLEDMGALSALNAQMVRDGVGVRERKGRLVELQGELVEGRERGFRKGG